MHPILRPGCHVLRRDRSQVQIGLDPQQALILPDNDDTRATLALLARAADVQEYDGRHTLDLLQTHGLLLDAGTFLPLVPACVDPMATQPVKAARPGRPRPQRHHVAALARSAGDRAAAVIEARIRQPVELRTYADTPDEILAHSMADLLRETGVQVTQAPAPVPRSAHVPPATATSAPRVAALVGVGEPPRELVDGWMRGGVPHVLLRLTEGVATLGPFVVPGRTACVRCLDAHHTDTDPSWPLLVEQYARLSANERSDGVPEPVDGLLVQVAVAWAARDLTSFLEDRTPSTWSTTIRFDPHLTSLETRSWLRHPDCGCAWS